MSAPPAPSSLRPPLSAPLPDLAAWTRHLDTAGLPVLSDTAETLEHLRQNEDAVDANMLGEVIAEDPLMTLKVLVHAARYRPSRMVTDTGTVTAALLVMGIPPFFRAFGPQPTVEAHLAGQPQALAGLRQVVRRAHRAADFALGFAVHRMDHDAGPIYQATLLHDFAEMLLWVHAPLLALDIQQRQLADPQLRSVAAQQQVLGISLDELQQALMQTWRLPALLVRITNHQHAEQLTVRNVLLAVRLARHSAQGWDNPALPDDYREIAAMLNLSTDAVVAMVHDIDKS